MNYMIYTNYMFVLISFNIQYPSKFKLLIDVFVDKVL